MKTKLLLWGMILVSYSTNAQTIITVTLKTATTADVVVTKDGNVVADMKDADFSDGNGKLHIINKTTKNDFTLGFIEASGKPPTFRIPSFKILPQDANGDGKTDLAIDNNGKLPPDISNGQMTKGMGIVMNNLTLGTDKVILAAVAIVPPPKPKKGVNDNKLFNYVERQIDIKGYIYLSEQNLIIDNKGTIHIYLDENGNPIYSYFPVTAKENVDKFQFHILSQNSAGYVFESDAELKPIEISEEIKTTIASTQSDGSQSKIKYTEYLSPIFGPYTTTFPFTISKTLDGTSTILVERTLKLLKTNRVSLGTAVIATWLKNAENITTFRKPGGDTTLIADNKNTRGFLGLFLTFHLIPRNLNIPPRYTKERLGISVGTNLSDKAFNNFFLGLNIEVTNGLFLNFGTHFGQVNYAVGYDKFKFGDDKFTGTLVTKKKWEIGGPYVAINIDAALFKKAFNNILGSTAN